MRTLGGEEGVDDAAVEGDRALPVELHRVGLGTADVADDPTGEEDQRAAVLGGRRELHVPTVREADPETGVDQLQGVGTLGRDAGADGGDGAVQVLEHLGDERGGIHGEPRDGGQLLMRQEQPSARTMHSALLGTASDT